jgi:hypothetical protein
VSSNLRRVGWTLAIAMAASACRGRDAPTETSPGTSATTTDAAHVDHLVGIVDIEATGTTVCALSGTGEVYCWEYSEPRQDIPTTRPLKVPDLPPARQIGVFDESAQAIANNGEVFAWGKMRPCYKERFESPNHPDNFIEPVDPTLDPRSAARRHPLDVQVIGDGADTQARVTTRAVTLRLRTSGRAMLLPNAGACVQDEEGRLACCGLSSDVVPSWVSETPRAVPGLVDLCESGTEQACLLFDDGRVECFDETNLVADRGRPGVHFPVSLPARATSLACDGQFVALLTDGTVARWGVELVPEVRGALPAATLVETGSGSTCILDEHKKIWCRYERALADPFPAAGAEKPWQVEGVEDPTDLAMGFLFSCALRSDGRVMCWPGNEERWGHLQPFTRSVGTPTFVPAPAEDSRQ